ncbi:3-oxoacyl-ACP synthase [Vibrio sp. HA2012]|uniref:beta-ketoacyl synthase chain length factor n=1 Tax=Vibrio sp. HA2012 TaxID=1971595 RepID=UPI000C2C0C83|nr:beta-ketoacyl synthase chain length factor [Vibrio sp. HA2012]PJC85789.1 3-oxoacyl-ACP synthase [Vibrio sp. HA2012]
MSKKIFSLNIALNDWYALSQGLNQKSDWQNWSESSAFLGEQKLPVHLIPAMMRRRMSMLSKLATQVALQLLEENCIDYMIFSSRHGELHRTVELLTNILSGEDASPMAFSQSVHNTAAGLTTIAAKQTLPVTSIAAGEDTFHQALVEAYAYLSDNQTAKVMVVDFDEPLPAVYAQFEDKQFTGYAVGYILSSPDRNTESFCVSCNTPSGRTSSLLPQSVTVLRHLLEGGEQWDIPSGRFSWGWLKSSAASGID